LGFVPDIMVVFLMRDLSEIALGTCNKMGATYADIRIVTVRGENITIKKGNLEVLDLSTIQGFGIRTIANGGWGFAGSYELTSDEIRRVASLSVRIAKASGSTRKEPVKLTEEKPVEDDYSTSYQKNPFAVPLEEKLEILNEADKRLREYDTAIIKTTTADYRGQSEHKVFASSEGAYITQKIVLCGGGISCTAVTAGAQPQRRSYPGSFRGNFATKGYEFFEGLELLENTEKTAQEAIELTTAPHCPTERTTVLLDSHQLMLQIHESCGHPTELDRVLGSEAAFAGTSFMTPDLLGQLRYGSEHVTLVSDCTLEG